MTGEALFILRNGRCGQGWSVNAVATEAGYFPFSMTGSNAANLTGAIFMAAETNGFTRRRRELAGITNLRRIGSLRMFGGIAVTGIAALFCVGVMVTREGFDNVFMASGARFPLAILPTGRVRDKEHRN